MFSSPIVIVGPPFSSTLVGSYGTDFILGGNGDDSLTGLAGVDFLNGGGGNNTVNYQLEQFFGGFYGVEVNLAAGAASDTFGFPDLLGNIQNVVGTDFPDSLVGAAGANVIVGNGGNDYIAGGLGNDLLYGGLGSDSFDLRSDVQSGAADVIGDFNQGGIPDVLGLPFSLQGATTFGDFNGSAFASVNLGLGNDPYTVVAPGIAGTQLQAQTVFV